MKEHSQMNKLTHFPSELLDALSFRYCVPFIGAGFSKEAGVISGKNLSIELCERLKYRGTDNVSLSKSATIYENRFSFHALHQYVAKRIQETGQKPGECHRLLAELLQAGLFSTVISANWDNLLEKACGADFDMKTILHDTTLPYLGGHKTVIIKYHGSVDRPASLVITEQDEQDFLTSQPGVVAKLKILMQENTIIFIGFGMADHDFRKIHNKVRQIGGKHGRRWYLICPQPDGMSVRDWEIECLHYWLPQNIEVIPVPAITLLRGLKQLFVDRKIITRRTPNEKKGRDPSES